MKFTIGNQTFDLADLDADSLPRTAFVVALDAANKFAESKAMINADSHLTPTGKLAKLEPLARALWSQIFASAQNIEGEAVHLAKREAAMLDVGAPASANEIARDSEIRAWWRSASVGDKERIVRDVEAGSAHSEFVRAMLRSPVPDAVDIEKRLFRDLHDQTRRLDNPAEAVAIEDGKRAVEWAQRGMGHIIGMSHGLTVMDDKAVIELALDTGRESAALAMGYTLEQLERAKVLKQPVRRVA